jgi:hypothetical protein
VQHHRAFVVDDGAKDTAVSPDVAEPVAEIHRTLLRLIHRPTPHLPQHVVEQHFAAIVGRVERGEILGEAFAQPLLVIVLPAHGLAPPLVRDLVREEVRSVALEGDGIVSPVERRHRQRLIEHREIRRAVAAREIVFGDGEGEHRIRCLADERRVVLHDRSGAIDHSSRACRLPRIGPHVERDRRRFAIARRHARQAWTAGTAFGERNVGSTADVT